MERFNIFNLSIRGQFRLNYIAYAQWPNKLTFDNSGNNLPEEASYYRNRMRSSCEKVVVLEKLEVIADLTKNKQSEK